MSEENKITFIRSMKGKLLLLFLAVSVIPLLLVGGILYYRANTTLRQEAYNKLEIAQQIKKIQVESYFAEREGDMGVLVETVGTLRSEAFRKLEAVRQLKENQVNRYFVDLQTQLKIVKDDPFVIEALDEFEKSIENEEDSKSFNVLNRNYGVRLSEIAEEYGWYDLFLIAPDGDIIYSVTQESDLFMNIPGSQLSSSSLGGGL